MATGPGQLTPDVPHILRVLLVEDHRIFRKGMYEAGAVEYVKDEPFAALLTAIRNGL